MTYFIAHGRRIRACLKQPEFAPVSITAQITVLLALTADLFDDVPLDRMTDAEQSVRALGDYYHTVELGLGVFFRDADSSALMTGETQPTDKGVIGAVVFGSNQGLVGQFNDVVADYAVKTLASSNGQSQRLDLGSRRARSGTPGGRGPAAFGALYRTELRQGHYPACRVDLVESETRRNRGEITELYLFYNRPGSWAIYTPVSQRMLPLDETWRRELAELPWPMVNLPEIMGGKTETLRALIREYLFVSLFRACAESLAS
jgi:F-type H+-transporting ATPase subunit gamma